MARKKYRANLIANTDLSGHMVVPSLVDIFITRNPRTGNVEFSYDPTNSNNEVQDNDYIDVENGTIPDRFSALFFKEIIDPITLQKYLE
jgi:hypothetical protein